MKQMALIVIVHTANTADSVIGTERRDCAGREPSAGAGLPVDIVAAPRLVLTHPSILVPHEHVVVGELIQQHVLQPDGRRVVDMRHNLVVCVDVPDYRSEAFLCRECRRNLLRATPQVLIHVSKDDAINCVVVVGLVVAVGEVPGKNDAQRGSLARRHRGRDSRRPRRSHCAGWAARGRELARSCEVLKKLGRGIRSAEADCATAARGGRAQSNAACSVPP